jgi:hypothetical protein
MANITRMIRDNDRVTVFLRKEDGELECQYFPKSMTNDDIKAVVSGEPLSETPANEPGNAPENKEPTIPEPPPAPRQRITREQMIAELAKAKVKVNVNDPAALKAAYRTHILQKQQGE